jgi:glycosyltransferase involved in cell wall biosynthesis
MQGIREDTRVAPSPAGPRVTPTVSVVVATYNRRDNLEAVVRPLLDDPATTELVVVVDGCNDGSIEYLEDIAKEEPRLKPFFVENSGAARAQQAGVEAAAGDVVLIVDDDVIAAPRLVTGHARHHTARQGIVVLGYMPTRTSARPEPGEHATALYARAYEQSCARYEHDPQEILRALWGGNVSLRRRDCLRVPLETSGFREGYHYDREWGLRLLKAGLIGVFDRSLLAEHRHRRPLAAALRDARNEGRGRVRLHQLHGDVLGPLDTAAFERNLPPPARWLVRAARYRRFYSVLLALLTWLTKLAGRLRLSGFERRAIQLLRRMEINAGAREALRSAA